MLSLEKKNNLVLLTLRSCTSGVVLENFINRALDLCRQLDLNLVLRRFVLSPEGFISSKEEDHFRTLPTKI